MWDRLKGAMSALEPFAGLAFVYLIFLAAAPETFHSLYNTKTIFCHAVTIGVGAVGMTVVIIAGGIDLSVGSMIALGTVITALVLKHGAAGAEPGLLLPLVAGLTAVAVCAFCGFMSGTIISWFRIVPFIVTLGMMQIVRGIAKGLADESTVDPGPSWLDGAMNIEPSPGTWYSIAPGVWLLLGLTLLMAGILRYTAFGRHVFAVGSNEATARLCGIRVGLMRIWIYTLGGALAGMASVMQFAELTLGDPTAATGMELDIIAAVVIGGGSLSGGEGSVFGSLIGALIIAVLRNGCNLIGIPNYVQGVVIGLIIIAAVGLDRLRHRGI